MNVLELTGKARTHITQVDHPRFAAQPAVIDAFWEMRNAANKEGIELAVFSSFRNYKTQLRIWNKKNSGQKPLYNEQGNVVDYSSLSKKEIVYATLRWSALPGASRHHWGTEIDVIDQATIDPNYKVKLLPEEVEETGVFYRLHQWLDTNIHKFGFFQPYKKFQGGMYAEPWHLSFIDKAKEASTLFTYELIRDCIENSDMGEKKLVLELLPEIYSDYVVNITKVTNDEKQ